MQDILEAIMAAEGRPDPAARAGRHRHGAGAGDATAAWWSARTRPRCSTGMASRDKDPRKSLHVQEVPTPELGPGEALSR